MAVLMDVDIKERVKVNLLGRLPDIMSGRLKSSDIVSVIVKYENFVVTIDKKGNEAEAPKDVKKSVKTLENKARKYITYHLQRYYNTRALDKMILLEKGIEGLEEDFYNDFAWRVNRDWENDRKR